MASNMTIDDIASALGVSKTTVSRAISGKGRISEQTRERVRSYIEKHNYRPSSMARGLAQSRTFNICVTLPGEYGVVDLPFFRKCIAGVAQVTEREGYDIMLSVVSGSDLTGLQRIVEHRKADGVILTRTMTRDRAVSYLKKKGFPFVAIGASDDPDIVCLDQDNLRGCRDLTGRLLQSGMKRLALIGGDETHVITGIRKRAFEEAHREAGLEPDPDLMILGVLDSEKVDLAVRRCLDLKADCIVCMSDRLAGSILVRCSALGIRIPEDIGIASCYGSSLLENASPRITSVYFNEDALGAEAASLLFRMIEGEKVKGKILEGYTIRMEKSTQMPDRDGGL